MNWYEITVKTNKDDIDMVSEFLLEQGCGGVTVEDPEEVKERLENPLPLDYVGEDLVEFIPTEYAAKAYFSIDADIDSISLNVQEKIEQFCNNENKVIVKIVNDDKWDSWKEYFKPFELIEGVFVVPSWEDYNSKEDETIIKMDPGMAFGTGTHETTKLCSYLTHKYAQGEYSLLDLGTGTGILSIIAYLKGVRDITAVDIDDAAVRAAKDNFEMNDVSGIAIKKGTIEDVSDKYNFITANILAEVLIDAAPDMRKVLKAPGFVILSGIIKRKEDDVKVAFEQNGFNFVENIYENDWVAMVFQCRDFIPTEVI